MAQDPTNPLPALAKNQSLGRTAAPGAGMMRPDAEPENPQARGINPFKQALNLFLFGSRDPSYGEVGESRASDIQRKAVSDALLMAPPGDPARATVVAQMGAYGAQAAQAMRERYYAKEYKQVVSTQIVPIKERIQALQAEARDRLQFSNQPVPRLMTAEEGAALSVADQAATPAPPEQVQTGTTAEGKPKTKVVPGVAPPTANPAISQGQVGATVYDQETPTIIDPVTGTPVPVASARGIAIEQQVTDEFLAKQNDAMLEMMDILSSYAGNPYADAAMSSMIEGVVNMAGTAVTGRSDPKEMQEWWEARRAFEADQTEQVQGIEAAAAQAQTMQSTVLAQASDAAILYSEDKEFAKLVGPKLGAALESKGVENLTPKQQSQLAAMQRMYRDQQEKQLQQLEKAGMIAIPPARLNHPETWHNYFITKDPFYQDMEKRRFAEMQADVLRQVQRISSLPLDRRSEAMKRLGVPDNIYALVHEGKTETPEVRNWVAETVMGSSEYEDAKAMAYMERLEDAMQIQPEVHDVIRNYNENWINAYRAERDRQGNPLSTEEEELLRADELGTFYHATHGRSAPQYFRPTQQAAKLEQLRSRQRVRAQEGAMIEREGREPIYSPEDVPMTPEEAEELLRSERPSTRGRREEKEVIPDEQITIETPVEQLSQRQIYDQLGNIYQMLELPETKQNPELRKQLNDKANELRGAYKWLLGRGGAELLEEYVNPLTMLKEPTERLLTTIGESIFGQSELTQEEAKEKGEKARIKRQELLRYVPGHKVN